MLSALNGASGEQLKNREIVEGANVPKGSFFAADVGTPASINDYGAGDVGANDYKDALFHPAPRGKNKPKITDDAVIKLPDMKTVERGYSEARAQAAFKAIPWKTTPWTPEEDKLLAELVEKEKDGGRGRWSRISKALMRTYTDVSTRWTQVLSTPKPEEEYQDILRDAEKVSALQGKGQSADKYNWMNKDTPTYTPPHITLNKQ